MTDARVRDANGEWVAVGDRVRLNHQVAGQGFPDVGTVVSIGDADGDVRGGQMVGLSPTVCVRGGDWDDSFPTRYEVTGDHVCDDVVLIERKEDD